MTAVGFPVLLLLAATTTLRPVLTAVKEDVAFFMRYLVLAVKVKVNVLPFLVLIDSDCAVTWVTEPWTRNSLCFLCP